MNKNKVRSTALLVLGLVTLIGCRTNQPLPTADSVDLGRFMGSWYVVGYTPIVVDKEAFNAVEHYAQDGEGKILTTYQFRKGAFDGPLKTHTPTGFVHDKESNVEWRMQFVWPFKAKYIVLYLSDDYQRTIIAHPNRKYAWIMQRSPAVDEAKYSAMLKRLEQVGFDSEIIQRVPHDWENEQERLSVNGASGKRASVGSSVEDRKSRIEKTPEVESAASTSPGPIRPGTPSSRQLTRRGMMLHTKNCWITRPARTARRSLEEGKWFSLSPTGLAMAILLPLSTPMCRLFVTTGWAYASLRPPRNE